MDLYTIHIDASALNKMGGKGRKTEAKLRKSLEQLTEVCVQAYQSKVPIDTGELRQTITPGPITVSTKGVSTSTVVLKEVSHHGNRGIPIGSSELAIILQNGKSNGGGYLHRSRDSEAVGNFAPVGMGAPTAQWITKGTQAFNASYKRYLNA
jgi:hypothetical protein